MVDYLSASQLELFKKSPLDWAMRYIEKLSSPYAGSASKGTLFHSWVRNLVTGHPLATVEGLSDIERYNVEVQAKCLVSRHEDFFAQAWVFEVPFNVVIIDGAPPFRGFIDLLRNEEGLHVFDIKKTTRTLPYTSSKGEDMPGVFYGLSERDLKSNLQLAVYVLSQQNINPDLTNHGRIGHLQGICVKRRGMEVGFETNLIEMNITPFYIKHSKELVRKIIEEIISFKKFYELNGLHATIEELTKDGKTLLDIAQPKVFARTNPFWKIYNKKQTINELREILNTNKENLNGTQ